MRSLQLAVTNGTFHLPWTRARVRSWRPLPRRSITACSATWLKISAIVKNIVVHARHKLTFACAATAFTTALRAGKPAATEFPTSGAANFSSTEISPNGVWDSAGHKKQLQ